MTVYSENIFDLGGTPFEGFMRGRYPWEILDDLDERLVRLGEALPAGRYRRAGERIWIAKSARVDDSASIAGPCIIGEDAEVRRGAYIRGGVLLGRECVVGNATEVKNAVLFDGATAPHFNYVGDSILGRGVHLGAGVILSNLRADRKNIVVKCEPPCCTGRRKLGGILGDGCEVGCQSVINPGTVLGRGCVVYPLTSVTGVWEAESRIGRGRSHG